MANQGPVSDGTSSWIGGMDSSRGASDISGIQYSRAINVVIPESGSGLVVRPGIHCAVLEFDNFKTEQIYKMNPVLAEGYISANNTYYLLALVSGYVLKFTKVSKLRYRVDNITEYSRFSDTTSKGWITSIPGGCIVSNGFDKTIHITPKDIRILDPSDGDIGISKMAVYVQNRLFYVDQSSRQILASDFRQPTRFTLEGTNIFGFACPDSSEKITAIGRQKSILGGVEGGNLIWSSTSDIYSADIRGSRSDWANLGSSVGKTTETVPGFSASSHNSFEAFNTNIYFRTSRYGIATLKNSQYQFVNFDALANQSVEASYFLDNDTHWMLKECYTRACNKRLFTTVAPQLTPSGHIVWNGILSMSPPVSYGGGEAFPRRCESVLTGVRPWCLTVVKTENEMDTMFIHSSDIDGINRLYVMDEDSKYDINQFGQRVNIRGHIETRAYSFSNKLIPKKILSRLYRLGNLSSSVRIDISFRPDASSPWEKTWSADHLVQRIKKEGDKIILGSEQNRPIILMSSEKMDCYPGGTLIYDLQYRIEFSGPINLDAVIILAEFDPIQNTISKKESKPRFYELKSVSDYYYKISNEPPKHTA